MPSSSFFLGVLLAALLTVFVASSWPGQSQAQSTANPAQTSVQLINSYPQFQLHGQLFFAHSAAFFYNRIPRDEWGPALAKLKSLGINTIDLYLAWNWHEPEEGKLDFDGHSNPRRDVKALLAMLDAMGFAVIARPGPVILNEWRNGGYPDWLLARAEFQMHEVARLDGHYPPLAGVSASNSEEASKQWLANETHLQYTKRWFAAVMRELLDARQATKGGNLIAIQLDDDQAINRSNYNGPIFWRYMNTLAGYLRAAGATVPVYLNPTDMRVSAAGAPHQIGAMGQWYFNFGNDPALRWEDTAVLQFYTETLKTQPHFPPMIIEYQAGWYGNGEDTYAKTADATNTLLSSRVMLGHGLRGLNYFPVQDTLYPAGYEVPWANHYYIWESALTLTRGERPRADAVHRNGRLLTGLARELAAVHKAADVGLVYPISSFAQATLTREDILRISRAQMQVQQFCQLNQVAVEYLDLEFQPLSALQRHKVLLLPVFDEQTLGKTAAQGREEISAANERTARERDSESATQKNGQTGLRLSAQAQQKLIEYVNAGGTLFCTPALPAGELGKALANHPRLHVLPDFWRGIPIEPGKTNRDEVIASVQTASVEFVSRLTRLGVNRRVKARVLAEPGAAPLPAAVGATIEPNLLVTQLVPADNRPYGFVNLVNFDARRALRVSLNVADPAAQNSRLEIPGVTIRSRDALLLPMRLPLGESGAEEIVYATAEVLRRELANGKISLRVYAPESAEIVLRLPHAPAGGVTINGATASGQYDAQNKLLTIKLAARRNTGLRDEDELAGRRANEYDVEIVYEKGQPELLVKTARLLLGENNQVAVTVANRTAQPLNGELTLTVEHGLRRETYRTPAALKAQESRQFAFSVPVSANAVADDLVNLQARLSGNVSPVIVAEIQPRFDVRIYPKTTWPLRADTEQEIQPPLLYPADEAAVGAQFNLRFANNSTERITLTRTNPLLTSLPLTLGPDEELMSSYTFNYAPGEKSALNPFVVSVSDGKTTKQVKVNFVTLRKGEAIAFAYDIDRDGFDEYVLENEHVRLILSPRAGGRSFALINKRTGANIFTSVGGLRDKFVELDPQDPTRNARRKRGMYGTFNRPYRAEIVEGMGKQAVVKLRYDAPEVYPAGVLIERTLTLAAGEEGFTVDYRLTPKPQSVDGKQAFWAATSLGIGDPVKKWRRFVTATGALEFTPTKTVTLVGPESAREPLNWLAAPVSAQTNFALFWRNEEVSAADLEMKEFSSLVNVKFKPFAQAAPHTYRLAYYFGALPVAQLPAVRERMLRR